MNTGMPPQDQQVGGLGNTRTNASLARRLADRKAYFTTRYPRGLVIGEKIMLAVAVVAIIFACLCLATGCC